MAFENELAPNTPARHQGRLAYVPDDLLPPTLVGPIFEKAQETSLVMRMGTPIEVDYGETSIPVTTARPEVGQVGVGTRNQDREGYRKPVSGSAWDTKTFAPIKLATIVTASDEFVRKNPLGLYTKMQGDLAFAIGRGVDLAVFHGKQPINGAPLLGIEASNVLANTPNVVTLPADRRASVYESLLTGYEIVVEDEDFTAWAVDPRFRARLIRDGAERDVNGNLVNPAEINLNAQSGNILGIRSEYGRAVAGDLGAATNSGIKVIGGDFSKLRYGFADEIRVKVSDQATLTDGAGNTVNLWQTNQVALLIEVTMGWILGEPDAFVAFKQAPPTPVAA